MRPEHVVISDRRKLNISATLHDCGVACVAPAAQLSLKEDRHWFMLAVSGEGRLLGAGGLPVPVRAGSLVFAAENAGYQLQSDETLELYYVSFSGYLVREYFVRAGFHRVYPVHDYGESEFFREAFEQMLAFSHIPDNRYCKMLSRFYDMLARVIDLAEAANYNIKEPFGQTLYLTKALVFISNHYNEDITVTDIARCAGVGRKYLHAVFTRQIGVSPSRYLLSFRMDEACKLMSVSRITVAELARAVGYHDPFQFSRMFKRVKGMSPTEYKNQSRIQTPTATYFEEQVAGMSSLLRQSKREIAALRGEKGEKA